MLLLRYEVNVQLPDAQSQDLCDITGDSFNCKSIVQMGLFGKQHVTMFQAQHQVSAKNYKFDTAKHLHDLTLLTDCENVFSFIGFYDHKGSFWDT